MSGSLESCWQGPKLRKLATVIFDKRVVCSFSPVEAKPETLKSLLITDKDSKCHHCLLNQRDLPALIWES